MVSELLLSNPHSNISLAISFISSLFISYCIINKKCLSILLLEYRFNKRIQRAIDEVIELRDREYSVMIQNDGKLGRDVIALKARGVKSCPPLR